MTAPRPRVRPSAHRPERRRGTDGAGGSRRRASLSMDAVVAQAVAILDEAGESALTFRALALRLGGGVASIYWYVSSKDELLDRATDSVLAGVLTATESFTGADDPIDDLRAIAVALFDVIVDRPWLGGYFMRDTGTQPNGLLLYERLGQQAMRLGLTSRQSFHAVSAVTGFVVGVAADLGQQPPQEVVDGSVTREQMMQRYADGWRQLDPEIFPFIHHIVDEFAIHNDREQFVAGLDLLLAGLRLQTGQ